MGALLDGRWVRDADIPRSGDGSFQRKASAIRDSVEDRVGAKYAAVAGRYRLYVSLACPWAHRTLIARALLGLDDVLPVSIVDWHMTEDGWHFSERDGATRDHEHGLAYLRDLYVRSHPDYSGRVTVPVLYDRERQRIVNNESSEILRMLNGAFRGLARTPFDFYPEAQRRDIDAVNAKVYDHVNNGVYRCGFATSQTAYEQAFIALFETLDELEDRLAKQRYLVGPRVTEADIRLFPTLIRFDAVYHGHFKCNRRKICEYPNLSNYVRDFYALPGVAATVDLHHIRWHYYHSHRTINPTGIVASGPSDDFAAPHDRGRFG